MELETKDPVDTLKSKEIHARCAAARDLSKVGEPDHLPALVDRAQNDKSPAVRLCTAGAAADILSRFRTGDRRGRLSAQDREALLDLFKGIDPGVNAGLFPMLACLDLPASFRRIATGLRDPRGDVRVGAAVGLLRLCISEAHLGDKDLEEAVVGLLGDRRLKPDAVAEVARVCAAAGYTSALDALRTLDLGESAQAEVVTEILTVIESLEEPPTGTWVSDGRDAGEVNPAPDASPATLIALPDGGALVVEGEDQGGWTFVEDFPGARFRRMFFRRVGEQQPAHALQAMGRTWYTASPQELTEAIDRAIDVSAIDWATGGPGEPADLRAAEALTADLGETGAEQRVRAVLLARAGRPAEARDALEHAVTLKKLPPDTWFFLGEARHAAGDEAGAREAWENAVKKARRKKDWYVERSRQRLGDEA